MAIEPCYFQLLDRRSQAVGSVGGFIPCWGAGLGLAFARELVMAGEGTLILEQSAVMDGSLTTALLTLPISPAARDGEVPVNAQKDQV